MTAIAELHKDRAYELGQFKPAQIAALESSIMLKDSGKKTLSAVIDSGQDAYVCSSGFAVLQPRAIKPDVMLTYLRLPPVCALMDLRTSASLYPAISETDLLALPVPKIPAGRPAGD